MHCGVQTAECRNIDSIRVPSLTEFYDNTDAAWQWSSEYESSIDVATAVYRWIHLACIHRCSRFVLFVKKAKV